MLMPKKTCETFCENCNLRHLAGVDSAAPLDALDEALRVRGRADQLADELIVRLVVEQRLVQPGGDLLAAAVDVAGAAVVVAQQIVPEREPVLGVAACPRAILDDIGISFVRRRVFQKPSQLVGRRQQADQVEVDAAGKRDVVEAAAEGPPCAASIGLDDPVDGVFAARAAAAARPGGLSAARRRWSA